MNKGSRAINAYTNIAKPPDAEEGRYRILIEDKVSAIALGDSGVDFSAITAALAAKLSTADTTIDVKKFDSPLVLESAFKTDSTVQLLALRSVVLSITIFLLGSNIPVRIRGI